MLNQPIPTEFMEHFFDAQPFWGFQSYKIIHLINDQQIKAWWVKPRLFLTWYKVQENEHICVRCFGPPQKNTSAQCPWYEPGFWPAGRLFLPCNWNPGVRITICACASVWPTRLHCTSRTRWSRRQPANTGCLGWGSARVQWLDWPPFSDRERSAVSHGNPEDGA